jgi:hypothetical protein
MIELQFSYQHDAGSWVIAWGTQGLWSHVDARKRDGTLQGARSDAVGGKPPGVQLRPAGYAHWTRVGVLRLEVQEEQEAAFWSFWDAQLGKPYDMVDILDIALDEPRDWRKDDAWICSEGIQVSLEVGAVFKPALVSESLISPNALYYACSCVGFELTEKAGF